MSNIQHGMMNFEVKEINQNLTMASYVPTIATEGVREGNSKGEFRIWRII